MKTNKAELLDNKSTNKQTDQEGIAKLKTRLAVAKANDKQLEKRTKDILKVLDFKREVVVGGDTQTTKVKYPLLWAAYDNYISELTSTPPQTTIDVDDGEDFAKKIYWKGILDRVKRKIRLEDKRESFIQSFISSGKAVYKVGRRVETAKGKQEVEHQTADGQVLKVSQEVETITKNETFVVTVDPRKVWISPETQYEGPILGDECPYVIEEMIKTPEYIEEHYGIKPDDDELELINVDDDDSKETSLFGTGVDDKDDIKRVRWYAYYGVWRINGKLEKNAEVLFTKKRVYKARKFPYAHGKKPYIYVLAFPKFFKPTTVAPLEPVDDLDREFNENSNRARTYVRRMVNPKWAKLKGTKIDEEALIDPDVGVIIEESQPNAFRPVSPPPLGQEILNQTNAVEQLFYLVTGMTYGQAALNKSQTATGQREQASGSDVKNGRLVRLVERSQEELDLMILQLEQQYAPQEGVNIKVAGSDVVKMIRDKKRIYQMKLDIWARQMEANPTYQEPQPYDEYENFKISENGKSIITSYTREDIQGEIELHVITQSSNRGERLARANQYMSAIQNSANDPTVNRAELWKRWFLLQGEDDVDELIANPTQGNVPLTPPPTNTPPGTQAMTSDENVLSAGQDQGMQI